MKTLSIRKKALAVAISVIFAPALAANEDAGKRMDNARVDVHELPFSSEVQPGFAYPLPSGVSRFDAESMRAAVGKLPTHQAQSRQTLSDTLDNASIFASGSADLTELAQQALKAFAANYQGKPGLRLSIVGHTDQQVLSATTRKRFGDNQGLSEARALAVADFLRRALELPASAVAMAGTLVAESAVALVARAVVRTTWLTGSAAPLFRWLHIAFSAWFRYGCSGTALVS